MENKNHTIISTDTRKASNQIQHSFMIKRTQQNVYKRDMTQYNKASYSKPIGSIILSVKSWKHFFLTSEKKKKKVATLTTFIQRSPGNPSHSKQTRKKK